MIDARVFRTAAGYRVSLQLDDVEFDVAGPFDTDDEALEMARRSVTDDGSVYV